MDLSCRCYICVTNAISYMLFLFMLIDGMSSPIGLTSTVARTNGSHFTMDGRFSSSNTVPIMLWPDKKRDWVNPCQNAQNLCCLQEIVKDYRNDILRNLQGESCLQSLPKELITNSMPGVKMVQSGRFDAVIPSNIEFVALLFVSFNPFFILDAYQGFKMVVDGVVESNIVIAHNPCYSVVVPGTLASVCMHCNNPLPLNAKFVWTSNWYVNYQCDWQCNSDYVKNGVVCERAKLDIPFFEILVGCGSSFFILLILMCLYRYRNSHKITEQVIPTEEEKLLPKNEMIQFKGELKELQLRIKKN